MDRALEEAQQLAERLRLKRQARTVPWSTGSQSPVQMSPSSLAHVGGGALLEWLTSAASDRSSHQPGSGSEPFSRTSPGSLSSVDAPKSFCSSTNSNMRAAASSRALEESQEGSCLSTGSGHVWTAGARDTAEMMLAHSQTASGQLAWSFSQGESQRVQSGSAAEHREPWHGQLPSDSEFPSLATTSSGDALVPRTHARLSAALLSHFRRYRRTACLAVLDRVQRHVAVHAAAVMCRAARREFADHSELRWRCLVVSTSPNIAEFKKRLGSQTASAPVRVFHGGTAGDRQKCLHQLWHQGGVCLTTFGMLPKLGGALQGGGIWDVVILDEVDTVARNATRWRQLQCMGQLQFVVGIWSAHESADVEMLEAKWPQFMCSAVHV
eukprot:TRINITY_DN9545_c0_g3_i2.p1 TRINITY_DN9545_c0_g3~~TRINITY_DN9545_c0_g3_i2.p1  ORF type:complete len:382 (+),score=42.75 TRINITY_DN9545_c0_g3_i2:212-1357(+)